MRVSFSPISSTKKNLISKPQYRQNEQRPDEFEFSSPKNKKTFIEKTKEFFKKFKTGIAVLTSSLLTGLTVFAVALKNNKKLKDKNKDLQNRNNNLQKQLDTIILPNDIDDEVSKKIKKLNETELSYSPTTRIETNQNHRKRVNNNPVIVLPKTYQKTDLRSDAKPLVYPKFQEGKEYNFEFPMSDEVKITKDSTPITSKEKTLTTVSESYADSLVWNDEKIARDLMQNFYDGHGQTLDGVKFYVTPSEEGKYKVRIEGKSTFSADKAILLGESSKKDNKKAAGNYGEGLKMVVLKLLKEKGATDVKIASNNWKVNWNFEDSGFDKKVLAYQLDEIEPIDGNYLEFDTDNVDFIKSIINSFDKFYHYNNPSFKCPDFENDIVGIKLMDESEKGKFYIAGQAFEIDNQYDSLNGMNIYIKQKPPVSHEGNTIFDPSRDRISLTNDNLKTLGEWVISKDNMSTEDAVKLIHSLEDYWNVGTRTDLFNHMTKGTSFIIGLYIGASNRGDLNIKFPNEKDVSESFFVSQSLLEMYKNAGYRMCTGHLSGIGMRSVEELIDETRKHRMLEPTPTEKNKILIIQEAIQLLSPVLKEDNLFTDEELEAKVFIYDRNSNVEDKVYGDVTGESIVGNGKCLGFWLDRNSMSTDTFSTILSTSLHELTHKYGGDETSRFSYKLTDVMEKVFAAINDNPNLAIQLKVLEKAWNAQ